MFGVRCSLCTFRGSVMPLSGLGDRAGSYLQEGKSTAVMGRVLRCSLYHDELYFSRSTGFDSQIFTHATLELSVYLVLLSHLAMSMTYSPILTYSARYKDILPVYCLRTRALSQGHSTPGCSRPTDSFASDPHRSIEIKLIALPASVPHTLT